MNKLTPAKLSILMFCCVGLLIAAYVGKRMLFVTQETAPVATRNVPMALVDLEPGMTVTASDVGLGPVRVDKLNPNMLLRTDSVIGRVVRESIKAATPITTNQLFKQGELPALQVSEGMQAVTISLRDNTSIVNGLVKPGDRVDILLTPTEIQGDARLENGLTMTLLAGVKILTMNRDFVGATTSATSNSVTLELTPEDSRIVTLAQEIGALKFVYNPDGSGSVPAITAKDPDRITVDELLRLRPLPEPEPPAEPFVTEHYTAGARMVLRFRDGMRLDTYTPDPQRPSGPNNVPPANTPPGNTPPAQGAPQPSANPGGPGAPPNTNNNLPKLPSSTI